MIASLNDIFDVHSLTPFRMEEVVVGSGFAGKFDMMAKDNQGKVWVIDFKTQDYKVKPNVYDEWLWQLGAYSLDREIEDNVAGAMNIVIKKSCISEIGIVIYDRTQLEHGRRTFLKIFDLWKLLKGYDPLLDK